MKTSLLILLVSCSALILPARAAASFPAFGEIPLRGVAAKVNANGNNVTVDTERVMVALRLGSPNAVTADGAWLYYHYVARQGAHAAGQPATLVIRFRDGRVSQLTLADAATVAALRETPRSPAQPQLLAAAPRR
jgi:hypothetical protein